MITRLDKQNLFGIVGGAVAAICVFILISVFFQKTANRILVKGFFTTDTMVTVSTVSSAGNIGSIGTFEFKAKTGNKRADHQGTKVINAPIGRLRLDFEATDKQADLSSASFNLESIRIPMPYSKNFHFTRSQIDSAFKSDTAISNKASHFSYNADTGRATLESIEPIGTKNYFLTYGMSLLFFFGIWFLIKNSMWSEIPAFKDMHLGNKISSSSEFNSINGLRGLAALMVLFSHTAPGWESLQIGLGLLFVISGFLLSKPFVLDNHKVFSLANIQRYVTKRLKRILPMYYLFVFITYVLAFKFDVALRHFLFIQAEGHLWPMTQIFAFYMLLPFVLMICSAAHKIHRILPIALLATAIYFSITMMRGWMPFFNGYYHHEFALFAFLMGVLAAYIQYDFLKNRDFFHTGNRVLREALGLFALVLTVLTILWSAPMKPDPAIFHYLSQFYIKCILCVLIILLTINTPGTLYNKLMSNWLFRSVGVIGFSFYILHGLGMQIADNFALQFLGNTQLGGRSWEYMAGAFGVTYFMAIAAYSYVERPFFGYREKPVVDR